MQSLRIGQILVFEMVVFHNNTFFEDSLYILTSYFNIFVEKCKKKKKKGKKEKKKEKKRKKKSCFLFSDILGRSEKSKQTFFRSYIIISIGNVLMCTGLVFAVINSSQLAKKEKSRFSTCPCHKIYREETSWFISFQLYIRNYTFVNM